VRNEGEGGGYKVNTLFGKLEDLAIERLRTFEPVALDMHPEGYYLAYSGGKDSDVILHLAKKAGVKFTAHHHLTTCDPPELVYHVRTHPEVEIRKPALTMWQLIRKKGMPPRRQARFCCEALKEGHGKGRFILTGVRWGESNRRSKRRMTEACLRDKSKRYLHPIIDWTDTDVWNYIKAESIPYCKLYDEGQKRIGCVLCPMTRNVEQQIARWPRIAKAWEKAVKATYKPEAEKIILYAFTCNDCKAVATANSGDINHAEILQAWEKKCPKCGSQNVVEGTATKQPKRYVFKDAEEYWQWWLDRDRPGLNEELNQCMMFED
jgi:phosphoadenosine phosphosulfate reductase